MKPLLKISNLSVYFQVRKSQFCAVKDLNLDDFEIESDEFDDLLDEF